MPNLNIEKVVIAWLPGIVGGDWPVHGDMPDPRPESFVLVDRTGGPREAMVLDQAEILIEVYHKNSRESASDMALLIGDNVKDLVAEDENITRAKVNSTVKLDDTIGQYFRYQVYCDVYGRR